MPELASLRPMTSVPAPAAGRVPVLQLPSQPPPISTAALSTARTASTVTDALKDLPQRFLTAYDQGVERARKSKTDAFTDQTRELVSQKMQQDDLSDFTFTGDGKVTYAPTSEEEKAERAARAEYYRRGGSRGSKTDWVSQNAGLPVVGADGKVRISTPSEDPMFLGDGTLSPLPDAGSGSWFGLNDLDSAIDSSIASSEQASAANVGQSNGESVPENFSGVAMSEDGRVRYLYENGAKVGYMTEGMSTYHKLGGDEKKEESQIIFETPKQAADYAKQNGLKPPTIKVLPNGKFAVEKFEAIDSSATGSDDKFTDAVSKTMAYVSRAEPASSALDNIDKTKFDPTSAEGIMRKMESTSDLVKWFTSAAGSSNPDAQKFFINARTFVNAILRRDSGAAISNAEFANAYAEYIPGPGDSDEAIAEKSQKRKIAMDALKSSIPHTARNIIDSNKDESSLSGSISGSEKPSGEEEQVTVIKNGQTGVVPRSSLQKARELGWIPL